jgi:hypothetical protein
MKTSILALAIALAFSFTATPAAAKVAAKQKCDAGKQRATAKHLQCRTLAEAKNTKKPDPAKLSALLAKCDTKLNDRFANFEGKAPEDAMAAPEDQCSYYGDLDNVKALNTAVSDAVADGSASAEGADALSHYNCQASALCSKWAEEYPEDYADYSSGYYYGHDTAESSGCDVQQWNNVQAPFSILYEGNGLNQWLTIICR